MWVKQMVIHINKQALEGSQRHSDFLVSTGLLKDDDFSQQKVKEQHELFQGHKLWTLGQSDIVEAKFMMAFLTVITENEEQIEDYSDFMNLQKDTYLVLEELLYQLKFFFLSRNLDSKSLFRVYNRKIESLKD